MKAISKVICAGITFSFCACGTPAIITQSWHKPNTTASGYKNIFIAAITPDVPVRKELESNLQVILQQKGFTVEKSMDTYPDNFKTARGPWKDLPVNSIKPANADGVLTVTFLRREKEERFVPNPPWQPRLAESFADIYSSDPFYQDPQVIRNGGYNKTHMIYYMETNLYNAKTNQHIWSAQSKTYDPSDTKGFLKGYVQSIYEQMAKDGVINKAIAKL